MAKSSLPISSVNHFSLLCSSVERSVAFYEDVLGFFRIKRPGSFDFDGAWLFNYGMGIHLIQAPNPLELPRKSTINPKDNHMSFQTGCQDIGEVEERLRELGVRYMRVEVEEGGIKVDQIFFHDPDGFMIEVCTCENLPLVPLVNNVVVVTSSCTTSSSGCYNTSTSTTNTNNNNIADVNTSTVSVAHSSISTNIHHHNNNSHNHNNSNNILVTSTSCSNLAFNSCSQYNNAARLISCTSTGTSSACPNQQAVGAPSL